MMGMQKDVAAALNTEWAPVFATRPAGEGEFEEGNMSGTEFGPWEWQKGELMDVAARLTCSAPGPDAAPYQLWDRVLYGIAYELAALAALPEDLNRSIFESSGKGRPDADAKSAFTVFNTHCAFLGRQNQVEFYTQVVCWVC